IELIRASLVNEIEQREIVKNHLAELYQLFFFFHPMILTEQASDFLMSYFLKLATIESAISQQVQSLQEYLIKLFELYSVSAQESEFKQVTSQIFLTLRQYARLVKLEYEKHTAKKLLELKKQIIEKMQSF